MDEHELANNPNPAIQKPAAKPFSWIKGLLIIGVGFVLFKAFFVGDHTAQQCVAQSDDGRFATLSNKCNYAITVKVCSTHIAGSTFFGMKTVCRVENHGPGGLIASGASDRAGLGWQVFGGMRHTWEACEANYAPVAVAGQTNKYRCQKSRGGFSLAF